MVLWSTATEQQVFRHQSATSHSTQAAATAQRCATPKSFFAYTARNPGDSSLWRLARRLSQKEQGMFIFAASIPPFVPGAQEKNEAIFASGNVLGVEVTIPALAKRCDLGNIDPSTRAGTSPPLPSRPRSSGRSRPRARRCSRCAPTSTRSGPWRSSRLAPRASGALQTLKRQGKDDGFTSRTDQSEFHPTREPNTLRVRLFYFPLIFPLLTCGSLRQLFQFSVESFGIRCNKIFHFFGMFTMFIKSENCWKKIKIIFEQRKIIPDNFP